jgi:Xaa-Pro dipeptidase
MMVEQSQRKNEKELFFSLEEYQGRLASVREEMKRSDIDALLVNTPENILYLSGFQTPGYYAYQSLLVTHTHDPVLLIRDGEFGNAYAYSWLNNYVSYYDNEQPAEATARAMAEVGLSNKRTGLEMNSWFLTSRIYEELQRLKPDIVWTDASGTVERSRVKKSAREVEYIRQAVRTTEAGMRAAIEVAQAGKTDNDVAAALSHAMIEAGSEYPALGPFVAVGKRSSIMHGIWGRRPIESGQSIILEIGGVINRYNGALMRTISIGRPSRKLEAMAKASEEANRLLVENIKPGAMTADLHSLCMGELERHGYGGTRKGRRCGYSIGLAFPPDWGEGHILSIIDKPNVRLEPGMVFHLPLSVRVYREYGASFSETVLVTKTGHEVLTNFERKLFVK